MRFDLNDDELIDDVDVRFLIEEIAGTHLGDFDFNGRVEFTEFLVLSASFGREDVSYAEGDAPGDNVVNFDDYLVLSANFGDDEGAP